MRSQSKIAFEPSIPSTQRAGSDRALSTPINRSRALGTPANERYARRQAGRTPSTRLRVVRILKPPTDPNYR
jgi:hypothetical protein